MESFVPVVFLIYFFINIVRCKNFYRLCNEMGRSGMEVKINDCFISIKKKGYRTKSITQSMEVSIETHFRTIKSYSVQTNDFFVLFFQLYDFGIFRRYIRPVVFKKNIVMLPNFMKNIYIIETYESKKVENDTYLKLNKELCNIECLVLPVNSGIMQFINNSNTKSVQQ
jgi:hypothetical protein